MVKKSSGWQHQTHRRAALVFDQLATAAKSAPSPEARRELLDSPGNPYFAMLDRLYGEDYALARVLDSSDLVVHAEGPAAIDGSPKLRAVNWLCGGIETNLKRLAEAVLSLAGEESKRLVRNLDLRLTGFAPGSLYAGFALAPIEGAMLDGVLGGEEEPVFVAVRDAIRGLPIVPQFISDEQVLPGIADAMPDPAVRDASLSAVYRLAPTGRVGIHTLEIAAPSREAASVSQRERVVLRQALQRPTIRGTRHGTFVGRMREIDLDINRFHLRDIEGIGTLRCVMEGGIDDAARHLGGGVRVTGEYETDRNGRPRLMKVESIKPYGRQLQIDTRRSKS